MENRISKIVLTLALTGLTLLGASTAALGASTSPLPSATTDGKILVADGVSDEMFVLGMQNGHNVRLDLSGLNRSLNFLRARIGSHTQLVCRTDGTWVILNPANQANAITLNVYVRRARATTDETVVTE